MARPLTTPESNLLNDSAYQVSLRVLIADGDNVLRDYSNRSGHNWIDGVSINHDIDQPVSQATITLRRDIKDNSGSVLSLSPLRTDSILNRNAASQFSPAIDAGRRVEVYAATTAVGVAPISSDWKSLFVGTIDEGDYTRPQISLVARDLGGFLVDRWIEEETQYGSTAGVPIQTVMQAILDNWAEEIPLYVPVSPGFLIKPYKQAEQPVMEALQTLADLIGWAVRYKWHEGSSSWRLTLWQPNRTKTVPDRTIGPSRYLDVTALRIGRADVRNVIKLKYPNASTGQPDSLTRIDTNSVARYGRKWFRIVEGDNSSIDTPAEATAMADAILADLKDPKADNGIDMHFDWSIELEDLIRFQPNGIHYDTNTDLSVVSLQHTLSMDRQRTTIATRGKPCGKFLGWLAKESLAEPVVIPKVEIVEALPVFGERARINLRVTSSRPARIFIYRSESNPATTASDLVGTSEPGSKDFTFSDPSVEAGSTYYYLAVGADLYNDTLSDPNNASAHISATAPEGGSPTISSFVLSFYTNPMLPAIRFLRANATFEDVPAGSLMYFAEGGSESAVPTPFGYPDKDPIPVSGSGSAMKERVCPHPPTPYPTWITATLQSSDGTLLAVYQKSILVS